MTGMMHAFTFQNTVCLFLVICHLLATCHAETAVGTSEGKKLSSSHPHPRHDKCETLKTSLTYSQENAPQDISGVVSVD